jgi:hypothetical protein
VAFGLPGFFLRRATMIPLQIMFAGYLIAFGLITSGIMLERPRMWVWGVLTTCATTLYGAMRLLEFLL